MKLFFKVLLGVFLFELLTGIILMLIAQTASDITIESVVNIGYTLLSFPIYLIDKTYPFFADGPQWLGFLLWFINLLLQSLFVWFIFRYVLSKKSKSTIE